MADQKRLHILGIYGHAMRGVAAAAHDLGYVVSGTDQGANPPTEWIEKHPEITVWRKPAASHLRDVDEVIVGGGIAPEDPELVEAQQRKIPVRSYPELVAELTANARRIVVAGTHGKTTVTSLLAWIFETAGHHPDYLVGIKPRNFDSSVRLAGSRIAILEGDEYRASQLDTESKFAYYRPDALVLTSIEMDHPDFFTNLADITKRFRALVKAVPKRGGRISYWHGSPTVRKVAGNAEAAAVSYDLQKADWTASDVRYGPDGLELTVRRGEAEFGRFQVGLYGVHNIRNVLGAVSLAVGEGIPVETLTEALKTFTGATRRFSLLSDPGDPVTVIDDYAHHPTEAAATIAAAAEHFPGRVIAVYQPHTYSRTKELLKEYQNAFDDADQTFIAEIEPAREEGKASGVSGADIAKGSDSITYLVDRKKLLAAVVDAAEPGDTILSMSVGGNGGFAEDVATLIRKRG